MTISLCAYPIGHTGTPFLEPSNVAAHEPVSIRIYQAIESKNVPDLTSLLIGFDVWQDAAGQLLFAAVKSGDCHIVTALLNAVPEHFRAQFVQCSIHGGNTALIEAVRGKSLDIVNALLSTMSKDEPLAVILQADFFGHTALLQAMQDDSQDIVDALLSFVSQEDRAKLVQEVNSDGYYGSTPLMLAVKWHPPATVTKLLNIVAPHDRAAVLAQPNANGDTVLHKAVQRGLPIVTALLNAVGGNPEVGAEAEAVATKTAIINQANLSGATPLMYAVAAKNVALVRYLLSQGAKIDAVNNKGRTALHKAAQQDLGIAAALLNAVSKTQRLAIINLADHEGVTPLMYAAVAGNFKRVRYLLNKGARADVRDNKGHLALMLAAHKGHTRVVKLLLKEAVKLAE